MTLVPRPSLDRAALERVLARAAELQSQEAPETVGALSDEQILELGKEVGLTPEALRRAMAEERGRVTLPDGDGIAGSWLGAGNLAAARVVPGTPESVLTALDGVLRGDLPFEISRRFADRIQWVPKGGFLDAMRSQFGGRAEGMDLRFAEEVSASVVAVDARHVHVRLDASMAGSRREAVTSSVAWTGLASALGFVVAITSAPLLLTIPVFGGVTALGLMSSRRGYRQKAVRVGTALEQLLDRLEFGPAKRRGGFVEKLLG
jgi:hypothetical protein